MCSCVLVHLHRRNILWVDISLWWRIINLHTHTHTHTDTKEGMSMCLSHPPFVAAVSEPPSGGTLTSRLLLPHVHPPTTESDIHPQLKTNIHIQSPTHTHIYRAHKHPTKAPFLLPPPSFPSLGRQKNHATPRPLQEQE
jgi:hypothetical protein